MKHKNGTLVKTKIIENNITLVHKAFILLIHVQFRLTSVPREGGRMGEREILLLFYLGKENVKTRQGLSSSKPGYPLKSAIP